MGLHAFCHGLKDKPDELRDLGGVGGRAPGIEHTLQRELGPFNAK